MKKYGVHAYILIAVGLLYSGSLEICGDATSGKHLDYSHMNLKSIPSHLPQDVIALDISNNNIRIVPNETMATLNRLKTLDLSRNEIQRLEPFAFYGLTVLYSLDIRDNKLSMTYVSFPLSVFIHIPNLRVLHIENNLFPGSTNTSYPDQALQNLKHLLQFYTNTFTGLQLGIGFTFLTCLKEFHSEFGVIGRIGNDTLSPFSATQLTKLILIRSGIISIEKGAFSNLKYLKLLDLSYNVHLGLTKALDSLYGLQFLHDNMMDIILTSVNSHLTQFEDRVINRTNIKYLKNICVANLDLSNNGITYLDKTFLPSMQYPECLRRLSFAGLQMREIQFPLAMLLYLRRFKGLKYLDLSDNSLKPPKYKRETSRRPGYLSVERSRVMRSFKEIDFYPCLEVLNVSGVYASKHFEGEYRLKNSGRLRVLDASYNNIYPCRGIISGLENLTVLNISRWDCSQLSPYVLNGFTGLEVLVAKGIRLNKGLESDQAGIFLNRQERMQSLNLADNGLTHLHPRIFSNLRLAKSLNLANNKFSTIPIAVRSMASLNYLDMSYNAITNLIPDDLKWLDELSHLNKNEHFQLSLYGNPLSCTCSTLDFILWVVDTNVKLKLRDNLTCTLENGTRTIIVNLKENLKDMSVACVSHFWLTFSMLVTALTVVILCISVVCYRYRHNIKYWFLTNCRRGATYEEVQFEDCEFDAFVAYNHEDYRWACHTLREFLEDVHGYRLCLHHRDFSVGESIQGNIVDAINSSRKIILVISSKYLTCDWGEFEIQMAGMRMVQSGRDNVVIAVMLEEIPVRQMPQSLLNMWKNITFLLWTNDPGDENIFWGRLKEAMRRN